MRRVGLRYFDDMLAVEFGEIARRRLAWGRGPVEPNLPPAAMSMISGATQPRGRRPTDHQRLFTHATGVVDALVAGRSPPMPEPEDVEIPDLQRQRPLPVPCDVAGLALSGGGVRSAALGLGALQALSARKRLDSF